MSKLKPNTVGFVTAKCYCTVFANDRALAKFNFYIFKSKKRSNAQISKQEMIAFHLIAVKGVAKDY